MYKKLILKNDFHNTQATFRVEHTGKIKIDDVITLTVNQVKKAKRLLCCKDCICSGELGTRANYHQLNDKEVGLGIEVHHDNRTGEILGASLYIERIW